VTEVLLFQIATGRRASGKTTIGGKEIVSRRLRIPEHYEREIGAEILATQSGIGRMTVGKNLSSTTTIEERA
jgi:hypothetical protein